MQPGHKDKKVVTYYKLRGFRPQFTPLVIFVFLALSHKISQPSPPHHPLIEKDCILAFASPLDRQQIYKLNFQRSNEPYLS